MKRQSSLSKTYKQKSRCYSEPKPTKIQSRKQQQQKAPPRNPLLPNLLNNNIGVGVGIGNGRICSSSSSQNRSSTSSNASSLSSAEASLSNGCLRFFLSQSSSSSTSSSSSKALPSASVSIATNYNRIPSSSRSHTHRPPIKLKTFPPPPATPQSAAAAASAMMRMHHSDSSTPIRISSPHLPTKSPLRFPPPPPNSDLDINSTSNDKTPPAQASVSPEIHCTCTCPCPFPFLCASTSSILPSSTTGPLPRPSVCYAAGHVVSGVIDKRKCRPRGILKVEEAKSLGGFEYDKDGDDDDDDHTNKEKIDALQNPHNSPLLPIPTQASMHWLLSPTNNNNEDQHQQQKYDSHHRSGHFQTSWVEEEELPVHNSPASPLSPPRGFSSDLLLSQSTTGSISSTTSSRRRRRRRRRRRTISASKLSNSAAEFPKFPAFLRSTPLHQKFPVSPSKDVAIDPHDADGDISPFSITSLGSGNVIQTPDSDSSFKERSAISWLTAPDANKEPLHIFDSELTSVSEQIRMSSLSSTSPSSSCFQFDCWPTTPSYSVDLTHFHLEKMLDDRASCLSGSTSDNVSLSQMRVSWRDGLVSQILEMDGFDCCRCLSDEEDIAALDSRTRLLKSQGLNVDVAKHQISPNGFQSSKSLEKEHETNGKDKGGLPSQLSCSLAESRSTDGGSLIHSEDSEWNLSYKNHLFQI